MTTMDTRAPTPQKRRTAILFAGISAGNFMLTLDATILNVALPSMKHSLHAPAATLPWAVDAYTVTLAGLMLASGSIADRWGPRLVYRIALVGFAVFSCLCAFAPNVSTLIVGRALQGVPAAVLVPASLALLAAMYTDPAQRAKKIGTFIAITGVAIAAGPVIGGFLVGLGGWRLVFLVNPPIAVLTLLASGGLSAHRAGTAKPMDRSGLLLSIVGLVSFVFGLISAGTSGWLRSTPLIALIITAAAFAVLLFVERRAASPVLPPALIRLSRVRRNLIVAVMSQWVYYGLLFSLTQWMVSVRGLSALEAGLAFLPMTVPVALVPLLTGRLVVRYGAARVMFAGLTLDLLGGVAMIVGGTSLPTVFAVMVLVGAGSPLAIPASIADMAASLPLELAGTGQGALNASRYSGTALGVAVFGTISGLFTSGVVLVIGAAATLAVIGLSARSRGVTASA